MLLFAYICATVQRKTFEGENFHEFRGFVAITESFLCKNRTFHQFAKVLTIIVSLYYHTRNDTRVVSVVISTQVGTQQGPRQSNAILEEPVSLSFTFAAVS